MGRRIRIKPVEKVVENRLTIDVYKSGSLWSRTNYRFRSGRTKKADQFIFDTPVPKPHEQAFKNGRNNPGTRFAPGWQPYVHIGYRADQATTGDLPRSLGGGKIKPIGGLRGRVFHKNYDPGGKRTPKLVVDRALETGQGDAPNFRQKKLF